jgi:hypothetical protein
MFDQDFKVNMASNLRREHKHHDSRETFGADTDRNLKFSEPKETKPFTTSKLPPR